MNFYLYWVYVSFLFLMKLAFFDQSQLRFYYTLMLLPLLLLISVPRAS